MVVKKDYSPDHQTYIDKFGLVNFTTKVHKLSTT